MNVHTKLTLVFLSVLQFPGLHGLIANNLPYDEFCNLKPVDDTTAPVTYCIAGAITVSLPASGCIVIWAKDLDRGSNDDVTPVNKLKFYLNGDPNKANIQICCTDFIVAGACDEYTINLDMWVEDEQGNSSVCKTTVILQDDLDVCGCQSSGSSIKGLISTSCNTRAEGNLKLTGPNNYNRESFGPYIRYYELLNGQYHLCIERNDNHLNGVTTADIVKLQRHILGIESFNTYAQLLSADVTNSSTVSAADITEIRRLILGINSQLTKVPSWIFVPSDTLVNPKNPPHVIDFKNGCWDLNVNSSSLDNINFTSIKMGDVNCTARFNGQENTIARNANPVLSYSSILVKEPIIKTDFSLDKISDIQGLQFTLVFDPSLFEFVTIESGSIDIHDEQISLRHLDEGKINIAWNKDQINKSSLADRKLFTVLWKKKVNKGYMPDLNFDQNGIKPLLIDENLNEIDLTLRNSSTDNYFDIQLLNDLNCKMLYLNYSVEKDMNAELYLTDINGHIILQKKITLHTGINKASLDLDNILQNGLYFLSIDSGVYQNTFKVLILN